jgi:diacylglycerol kinase (ATP)
MRPTPRPWQPGAELEFADLNELLLINPAGGRGRTRRRMARLIALAATANIPFAVSSSPEDLTARARQAAASGVERVLVAGGDGSQHLVVQGLVGTDCVLAPLPLGTGNDLAASLGVSRDLEKAFAESLRAPSQLIDVLRVDGAFVAGVAGIGFDSAATEFANRVHIPLGPMLYVWAVLHTLATFESPELRIRADDVEIFHGRALMVAFANIPRYGGGMRIAPTAEIDDGWIDVVVVRDVSRPTILRVFPKVYRGGHIGHPAVLSRRARQVTVQADRPLPAYGDGERLRWLADGLLQIEVVPGALHVVRPARQATRP